MLGPEVELTCFLPNLRCVGTEVRSTRADTTHDTAHDTAHDTEHDTAHDTTQDTAHDTEQDTTFAFKLL